MRKYDYESQKEYFIANTPPTPSECCDFEVPQKMEQSPKPTAAKLFHDLDKIFFDDENFEKNRSNQVIKMTNDFSFWENENFCSEKLEKMPKKSLKVKEKIKTENCSKVDGKCGKQVKRPGSEQGKIMFKIFSSFQIPISCSNVLEIFP